MRIIILIISLLFIQNCSKPKSVLICGDHVCVNKNEAEQYFKENLSIEVRVLNKKKEDKINLIELNLKNNSENDKEITIVQQEKTNKEIKTLTNKEIIKIKNEIKVKKKAAKNKIRIKNEDIKNGKEVLSIKKNNLVMEKSKESIKKNVNKKDKIVFDICSVVERCSMDEISKYILNQGKNKGFPDITMRE